MDKIIFVMYKTVHFLRLFPNSLLQTFLEKEAFGLVISRHCKVLL